MNNLFIKKLSSSFMFFAFFLAFQSSIHAQITIENATECDLWVAAAQSDANTPAPCDACTVTQLRRVAPSTSLTLPANLSCGAQEWIEVFYTLAPSGAHVAIARDNINGQCGGDFGVLNCGGNAIETNWETNASGATVVTLK